LAADATIAPVGLRDVGGEKCRNTCGVPSDHDIVHELRFVADANYLRRFDQRLPETASRRAGPVRMISPRDRMAEGTS